MQIRLLSAATAAAVALGPALAAPASVLAAPGPVTSAADLRLAAATNFRDLGGHSAAGGRTVRTGVVFRSNALSALTAADKRRITGAGITLAVDLRSAAERLHTPDDLPAGVRYRVADVTGPGRGPAFHEPVPDTVGRALADPNTAGSPNVGMSIGYPLLVTYAGADAAFRDTLLAIAGNPGGTVFHCTEGKDRTGWAAAVLLSILGVPRTTIEADYLASNRRLGRHAVDVSWLRAAFGRAEQLYGSMDGYVRHGLQLNDATVQTLRSRLLT